MTEDLKPCPAGHANPRICQERLTTNRDGFGVTCRTKDCGWEVVPVYDDIDTAAEAWNTRAESAEPEPVARRDDKTCDAGERLLPERL